MSRAIECSRCHTYLGEIRDAQLKKGMVHMCDSCDTAYRSLEMAHKYAGDKVPEFGELFGDIFGKKR